MHKAVARIVEHACQAQKPGAQFNASGPVLEIDYVICKGVGVGQGLFVDDIVKRSLVRSVVQRHELLHPYIGIGIGIEILRIDLVGSRTAVDVVVGQIARIGERGV